nr:MAG TPA: Chitin-binding domain type 3 [Caudoviricetes sp.]
MIIDGKKFTEIPSDNKSVVTFQRTIFENLKPLMDAFEIGVIHDISFDDNAVHKIYTDPMTFSKNESGYTLSFILTDVPQKDIDARAYNETKPLIKQYLQIADIATVYKYIKYLDKWTAGEEYQKDMRIAHNGIVYVVLSKHIAEDGKTPDKALGLYVIAKNDGSGNPKPQYLNWIKGKEYNAGDIVMHKGILWECTWNNNAREPSELALGWKKK